MSNPYQSPIIPLEPRGESGGGRERVGTSVAMILVGLFFCVTSGCVVLADGFAGMEEACRREGYFFVAYGTFYCFAGGLTCVFHVCYLICGRPAQHLAGIWAIGLALGLAGLVVAVIKLVV